jgi:hypothetical protein
MSWPHTDPSLRHRTRHVFARQAVRFVVETLMQSPAQA